MAFQPSTTSPAPYHKLSVKSFNSRTAQTHACHLLPHIRPHHRILDLGCGPGSITADLAELVPDGHVVGMDIDSDFIKTAITLAETRGLQNLTFRIGDVKKDLAGMESESVDVVHAHQLLLHLSNPLETLREIYRVLKPEGIFSTVDSAMRVIVPPVPGVVSSNAAYERYSRARGADPNFGLRHHIVAHEAGFSWQDMEISSRAMEEMTPERKASLARSSGPSAEMFVKAGVITSEEAGEQRRGYEEWADFPGSRWLEVASVLICWKR